MCTRLIRILALLTFLTLSLLGGRVAMAEPVDTVGGMPAPGVAATMVTTDADTDLALSSETPCPEHEAVAQPLAHPHSHKPLPCGDCSACHAVALMPAAWQWPSPELVDVPTHWHPDLDAGRIKACELYRPPSC